MRRKLPLFTQEEIAKELDFRIPPADKDLFLEDYSVKEKPPRGYGVQQTEENINAFLKNHNFPLSTERHSISAVKNPARFIEENLKQGNDVMPIIFMQPVDANRRHGHALLIQGLNPDKKEVQVIDPAQNVKKLYSVKIEQLVEGMRPKWDDNEREFYIFKIKS